MWKYLIILLHMTNIFTSGDRANIMIDIDRGSWLNDNDFEMMIKFSYPFSTCCNTLNSGMTGGLTTLFNRFIKIYKFDYTTGRINYDCRGYFLLGSTEERLVQALKGVPTAIATTEILIIVDADLRDNSPLLNISLFHHSNVNIVSRSGNWTLSENFQQPRVFKKVFRYSEMCHKIDMIDFEGRQLQVAVVDIPPFSYLSTTINRTVNGIEGQFFLANDERELDGVEVKLFLIMAERLNFTWMMRGHPGPDKYGDRNGSIWSGGVIGQLFREEVDLAFGNIWINYYTFQFVNLSLPWYETKLRFLVPRPKQIEDIWGLVRPFTLNVWIAVITIVILASIAIWWKAQINPRVPLRLRSYTNTLTELIGRFAGSWAPRQTRGIRVHLMSWHLAGLLLVTFYSSNLAALLTTPQYEPRIDTIQQFIAANLTWGSELESLTWRLYFDLDDPYAQQMPNRYRIETHEQAGELKILDENYAIMGQVIESTFFVKFNNSRNNLTNYRVMRDSFSKYYLAFAAQSWLVHSIDTMMLRLSEFGLVEYHLRDVPRRRADASLREVIIEYDTDSTDDPTALILKPLGAGFILLFTSYILATIVFCFELKKKNKKKPIINM